MSNTKVRHEYVEEVEFLRETMQPAEVCLRLGKKAGTLARALYREGRPDLAAPFNALYWSTREVNRSKLCEPCKLGVHQAHRRNRHDSHLCKCGFCKTISDNARHE